VLVAHSNATSPSGVSPGERKVERSGMSMRWIWGLYVSLQGVGILLPFSARPIREGKA
jgi:hypothetical protein